MNDKHLQQIFSHYIDKFEMLNDNEHQEYYKWQVAKRFHNDMDAALNAPIEEFATRLYDIKKMTAHMIDNYTQPLNGLVEFAKKNDETAETVRTMFKKLYHEEGGDISDKQKRIHEFIAKSHELREKHYPDSFLYKNDMHSVTAYLFFYDPDHNYLFKATNAQVFADCVEFYEDWGSGDTVDIGAYYRMCDMLVEKMKASSELMDTDASRFSDGWGVDPGTLYEDPEKHVLAFDLIYCCSGYGLFDGITFSRPKLKERHLIVEKKEKAKQLYKKLSKAREDYQKLEDAKEYVNSMLVSGVGIRHKKYGEGIIKKNDGTYISVEFPSVGVKTVEIVRSVANGIISLNRIDSSDGIKEVHALLKNDSMIKSGLSYAEKEFARYSEYMDE